MESENPEFLYFEDFHQGDEWHAEPYPVRESEVVEFATRYDPLPVHVDRQAAADSFYGCLIASGWHTAAIASRQICDCILGQSACIGSPGVDEIRWPRSVRPGDVLDLRIRVGSTTRSRTRPEQGKVEFFGTSTNQQGDVVMTLKGTCFFACRDPNPRGAGADPSQ